MSEMGYFASLPTLIRIIAWNGGLYGMITLDLHYGIRQLIKSPTFTVTAVLSLALGVGATVAMFSVVYGVLLHPFPYADVDRMCNLSLRDQRGEIFDGWF